MHEEQRIDINYTKTSVLIHKNEVEHTEVIEK